MIFLESKNIMVDNSRKARMEVCDMPLDVTNCIAKYIADNRISIRQIAGDNGIKEEKLIPGTTQKLDSHEFLTLCQYLQIKPEALENVE